MSTQVSFSLRGRNPDVLTCIANLSNDEVFTPPELANRMLDTLEEAWAADNNGASIWADSSVCFLDPCTKSGVFLREITSRLVKGLADEIPDLQKRVDHILTNQIFGIATTHLTSLLARRSLYCSKQANGKHSIASWFANDAGNVWFERMDHTWTGERCDFCGTSRTNLDRGVERESYAYAFIHTNDVKARMAEFFGGKMQFDVIIGNPPYQIETDGAGRQARPIYNLFVDQAKKLEPRYLSMIVPSRWFSGGMGLDAFRETMMQDSHLTHLVDYANAKECFPQNSVSGGVCYFLWERDVNSDCKVTNVANGEINTSVRPLNEFEVLVRYNKAVSIIHKVQQHGESLLSEISSPLMPFGLSTNVRGERSRQSDDDLLLHASDGVSYIPRSTITKGRESIDKYKVLISKTSAEHAGEPGKDGRFRVITSSLKVIGPGEVCTHSYFIIGACKNKHTAENIAAYLRTRFARFLILLSMSSINLSKLVFSFVPILDFSVLWIDEELYKKYDLTEDEIKFIESLIRPMEAGNE